MTATIEYVRASRWYGPVIALNDVTTVVEPGVTGLLGPNGAGKSTFLKLAAGQLAPSQGEVTLLGRPAWGSPEIFHHVGLCPEADALPPSGDFQMPPPHPRSSRGHETHFKPNACGKRISQSLVTSTATAASRHAGLSLALLRSKGAAQNWATPHFWAAFTLTGKWD